MVYCLHNEGLPGESSADSQAGLKMAWETAGNGDCLAFIVSRWWGWVRSTTGWPRLVLFKLPAGAKRVKRKIDFPNSLPRHRAKGQWWGLKTVSSQTSIMGQIPYYNPVYWILKWQELYLGRKILLLEIVNTKIIKNFCQSTIVFLRMYDYIPA